MGFSKALDVVRAIGRKYDNLRGEAVKSVHVSRVAAFNIIGELLYKVERTLAYLSEIEKVIEVKEGVGKFCGSWNYVEANGITVANRVNPALSVRFDESNNTITLSDPDTILRIKGGGIEIKFRQYSAKLALTKADIEGNADIIKSLASKLMYLTDSILLRIEMCGRQQYSIRL